MTVYVPSLESSLYLSDPQSVLAYVLKRYFRTPADTVPLVPDLIISLPWVVAKFGKDPDALTQNMQSDLQGCFNRIFAGERQIQVSVSYTMTGTTSYDVNLSVTYTQLSGEIGQTGASISLKNGRLVIPEDNLAKSFM